MSVRRAGGHRWAIAFVTTCAVGPVGAWAQIQGSTTEEIIPMMLVAIAMGLIIGYLAFARELEIVQHAHP